MLVGLEWDIYDPDGDEYYPAHDVAEQGNAALLELLMTSGADVDGPSRINPPDKATSRGHVEFVRVLPSFGAALDSSTKRCYSLNGAIVKVTEGPGLDRHLRNAAWSGWFGLSRLLLNREEMFFFLVYRHMIGWCIPYNAA